MFARLAGRPRVAVIRIAEAVARTVLFAARAASSFKVLATDKRDCAAGARADKDSREQRRQMRPHRETPVSDEQARPAPHALGRSGYKGLYVRTVTFLTDALSELAAPRGRS